MQGTVSLVCMLCLNILCGITKLPDILLFREMRSTGECAKTSEGDGHGTEPWISVLTLCALTLKMEGENYEIVAKLSVPFNKM